MLKYLVIALLLFSCSAPDSSNALQEDIQEMIVMLESGTKENARMFIQKYAGQLPEGEVSEHIVDQFVGEKQSRLLEALRLVKNKKPEVVNGIMILKISREEMKVPDQQLSFQYDEKKKHFVIASK